MQAALWVAVAVVHFYLGLAHLAKIADEGWLWTHVWKGVGATGGAAYMLLLAYRARGERG